MTRRDIILQVLAEASGRSSKGAIAIFESMIEHDLLTERGLDEEFSEAESLRMITEFRHELPGIRRWLTEEGILEESGNA